MSCQKGQSTNDTETQDTRERDREMLFLSFLETGSLVSLETEGDEMKERAKKKMRGKMLMVSLDEASSHFIESLNVIHVKFIKISFPVLDSMNNKRMNQESPTERKNFSWYFSLSFSLSLLHLVYFLLKKSHEVGLLLFHPG